MSYAVIQPPFTLRFREMPKNELKAYFDWFLNQIPSRVEELEDEVKTTSNFENWRADKSPDSLGSLGEWFARQVETRERTAEEIAKISSASSFPIAVPN